MKRKQNIGLDSTKARGAEEDEAWRKRERARNQRVADQRATKKKKQE